MMEKDMITSVQAVIGTNAWGSELYGKIIRGSYVEEDVIQEAVRMADKTGVKILGADMFRFAVKKKA